jgi:hypothetical protein
MTVEPVAGIDIKLQRARDHIQYLSDTVNAFYDRKPYRLVGELDSQTGFRIVRIFVNEQPDMRWGVIAGDAVHNLRSALDNLWHRLWHRPNTTAFWTSRYDGFPFFENPAKLETRFRNRAKNPREKAVVEILREIRPYDGGNDGIGVLFDLSNEDKHTSFVPALGAMKGTYGVWISIGNTRSETVTLRHPGMCPIKDGAIVARLQLAIHTDVPVDVHSEIAFAVVFGESPTFQGQPIVPLLAKLGTMTQEIANRYRPYLSW